ncbi:MAG: PIG-L family deacetylase, partial [Acidobacteriota bacterium]
AWAPPARAVVAPESLNSSELARSREKLQFLGSVLYVAAHPDDENTSLLAYLSQGELARTTYLSITRGDGGQNLIGTELGDLLGLIRTQELLEARARDGAEQRFTRAIDFGYTKSKDEALQVWGEEEVLGDVVRVIRTLRPDVIVMRFPGDGRGGHGQHTASALLAMAAFDAAADPERYPEQLTGEGALEVWQTKRLFWDAARFFGGGQMADSGISFDTGKYSPLLGRSFTEISAASRSMHQSQGFGASSQRGARENLLEHRLGEEAAGGLFDGVDTTWARVGGEAVGELLARASQEFSPTTPHAIVPLLLDAREELLKLEPSEWKRSKLRDLDRALMAAAGLRVEVTADRATASRGEAVELELRTINRSPVGVQLISAELPFHGSETIGEPLEENQEWRRSFDVTLPSDASSTQPYWLESPPDGALFRVADVSDISLPETFPLGADVTLQIEGRTVELQLPLLHRWTERVEGERYRFFNVVPAIEVSVDSDVVIFADSAAREVTVNVRGASEQGAVRLVLPEGWTASPVEAALSDSTAAPQAVTFSVTPPEGTDVATVTAEVSTSSDVYSSSVATIDYRHIPVQTVLRTAQSRFVRVEIERVGENVGYIEGAGDAVPQALRQIGYQVTMLSDEDLASGDLSGYDAIVVGIRAYNARPATLEYNHRLLEYVKNGGTLVAQYNTISRRRQGAAPSYGPYPFRVSRDRVSVEEAPVEFLLPEHPLLTIPNRLTLGDFDGWVQERGLYFPNEWDDRYEAPLGSNDPGEPLRKGGLLYARYGKGVYVYTGYSFFRELPAGVPGAYRLFVNMLSARQ